MIFRVVKVYGNEFERVVFAFVPHIFGSAANENDTSRAYFHAFPRNGDFAFARIYIKYPVIACFDETKRVVALCV